MTKSGKIRYFWPCLVITVTTVIPRLAALGDFPYLDDGYHAFMAQYIQHSFASGRGFPQDFTGYKIFETLFFWVWGLPGNAFVWLRAADLLVAVAAGWFLCVLLVRESGNYQIGVWLAAAALAGMNYPGVIQSGFKFSFFPAFACFFLALNMVRDAAPESRAWFYAGVLAALGVIFRETFFYFPLLGCAALFCSRNFRALWRLVLGGIAGAVLITAILALFRQQLYGIFEFYFVYGKIYGPEESRRWLKFLENGGRAIVFFLPLVALFLLALATGLKRRKFGGRAIFWLAAAFLPILEPLSKIGFLYHFSACLPGLAGFCARVYSTFAPENRQIYKIAVFISALAAFLMLPPLFDHLKKAPITWEVVKNFPDQGWPESLENKSTTLEAAAAIKKLLPKNGKVSSSGFAYFLFPASGALPPEIPLGDLSRAYIYSGEDPQTFKRKLSANPPDVVFVAHAAAEHVEIFEKELKNILDSLPQYERAGEIATDGDSNYGWLGYSIYRKKPERMFRQN